MKLKLEWWIIIALILLVIGGIILWPQPDDTKEKELQAKIELRDQAIFQLHREATKLQAKIDSDSVKQAQDKITYQTTIKKKEAVIANLRANPVVIKIREETPEVDSLLDAMEAKDSIQTERIITLESNLKELRVDVAGLTFNFQERLDLQAQTIQDLKTVTDDQRKQLRKTRRTVKLLKVTAVIGAVGGIFLGAQF